MEVSTRVSKWLIPFVHRSSRFILYLRRYGRDSGTIPRPCSLLNSIKLLFEGLVPHLPGPHFHNRLVTPREPINTAGIRNRGTGKDVVKCHVYRCGSALPTLEVLVLRWSDGAGS